MLIRRFAATQVVTVTVLNLTVEVSPRVKCGALNRAHYMAFQFGASVQLLTFTLSAGFSF